MIGTSIAHYKITEKLGEGGMGEVYRAADTKLNRDVALKILPDPFASDHQRMSRFQREAQVLASLNHLNIGAIYGLEEAEGKHALVLELIEGLTLGERIAEGPVPFEEAAKVALQVAEALEAAHDVGIIHRDLKPDNIKVKEDGTVKVLDFGLAKAMEGTDTETDISKSPTLSLAATQAGVILGTAAYMSPEQAKGKKVDRRADIWAFGVVFFEMLTGRRLFEGENVSEVLAHVITSQPDWDSLPNETPELIRTLLGRCLEKSERVRLQAIGEARVLLSAYLEDPSASMAEAVPAAGQPQPREKLPWLLAVIFLTTTIVLAFVLSQYSAQEQPVIRASVPAPENQSFNLASTQPGPVALSPDGTMLVFSTIDDDGRVMLYLRRLDAPEAYPIARTEGAAYPFWSPDSREIGFFAEGKLKKIAAAGGPPMTLCDAANGKNGTWNKDDTILFAPTHDAVIHRVSAAGGESRPVTEFNEERKDNSHRHPFFLPDGDHFLYLVRADDAENGNSVVLRSLSEGTERELLRAQTAAIYASGHLLFQRENTLLARPFNPDSLEFEGDAFPLAERVTTLAAGAAAGMFSASRNGILVYHQHASVGGEQLIWMDRDGNQTGSLGDPALYDNISLSPDGVYSAVSVPAESGVTGFDLWLYDLGRALRSRFTFMPRAESNPVWSPDGQTLYFRAGGGDIYRKDVSGIGEAEIVSELSEDQYPSSVTSDGRYLAFTLAPGTSTGADIWVQPLDGDKEPFPVLESPFDELHAAFSPDGRWLAYVSNESGQGEVYVTPFPKPTRKWQLSTGTGTFPMWRNDGKEIIYTSSGGHVMAAEISVRDDTLLIGEVKTLFETIVPHPVFPRLAATPDHTKFLTRERIAGNTDAPLTLVVNWTAEIEN